MDDLVFVLDLGHLNLLHDGLEHGHMHLPRESLENPPRPKKKQNNNAFMALIRKNICGLWGAS